ELLAERQLAGVTHLVATVEGELRPGVTLTDLLGAVLPGGSVTGCPKIAALDLIAALEPVGRGAAMGALGLVYPNGDLDLALTIRTFAVADGAIHLWVGGGVVWDSDPAAEAEVDVSVRLLWTAGREGGGPPAGLVLVSTLPPDLDELRAHGLRVAVVRWAAGALAGVKSTSYAANMAAQAEAAERGADDA